MSLMTMKVTFLTLQSPESALHNVDLPLLCELQRGPSAGTCGEAVQVQPPEPPGSQSAVFPITLAALLISATPKARIKVIYVTHGPKFHCNPSHEQGEVGGGYPAQRF